MSTYLSVEEAAARCRVSTKTVRRWIASGRLPVDRNGRLVRISDVHLAPLMGQHNGHPVDSGQTVHEDVDTKGTPSIDSGHAVLLELIRELKSDAMSKAESAAMWQARAEMLLGQVQQLQMALEAPKPEPVTVEPSPETEAAPEGEAKPWWKFWR